MDLGILPEPPQAWSWGCPHCGKRFTLKLRRSEVDKLGRTIRTYECTKCRREVSFADRHPPGAV